MQAVNDAAMRHVFAIDRTPLANASIPLTSLSPHPKLLIMHLCIYMYINIRRFYKYTRVSVY